MIGPVTRRRMLRASAGAALGLAGTALLAACGEEAAKEEPAAPAAPATSAATPAPAVEARAAPPQAEPVNFRYVTDHTSGPRGAAMAWGLAKFAQTRPNVNVRFVPQPSQYEDVFAIQMAAGTQAEVGMLNGGTFNHFVAAGGFSQINDALDKHPDFNPEFWYFNADSYTVNYEYGQANGELPPQVMEGPQYGMPFQGGLNGPALNLTLAEEYGIEFPSPGWSYENEFLEGAKKATDPEKGTWGNFGIHQSFDFNWGPVMFANGARSHRNASETEVNVFENGGDTGFQFSVDLIHKHKVAPPAAIAKEISGEFGDPMTAGKAWVNLWWGGYTGFFIPRIKDRFQWSLCPQPVGTTGNPGHWWSSTGNLVTSAATTFGVVEEATDFSLFTAGPVFQDRIAIERGTFPILKSSLDLPETLAAPPEGMKWQKTFMEYEDKKPMMMQLPNFWEFYEWRNFAETAFIGEKTVDEVVPQMLDYARRDLISQRSQYDENREKLSFPPLA